MIIITSFKLSYNISKGFFNVHSEESETGNRCPLCGSPLVYRDHKLRGLKDNAGKKSMYFLRRLLCQACLKLHTEIPSIIQPYKHYDSETIQSVLDGSEGADACAADDSTIRRWRSDFTKAAPDITLRMASVYSQLTDKKTPIGFSSTISIAAIQAKVKYWLSFVMALLINCGHKLCTQFAFCPPPLVDKIGLKYKTTVIMR